MEEAENPQKSRQKYKHIKIMALSMATLSGSASYRGDVEVRGSYVTIYDCNGGVSREVNLSNGAGSVPVDAYWSGSRVIVEMSTGTSYYITSQGVGVL